MDKNLRKIIESNPMFIEYGGAIDDEGILSEDDIIDILNEKADDENGISK
ncbi:MAG: hypothetical protein SO083_02130 [Megamonas funiformis]|jgi:hypothetical protein|uniref:Uncharacterized protein n=1 Tax=Megamonas funiformis TaxID=437897 RepID=A0AAW4UCH5_9FIRM|nr:MULTISPECIES: hypothetical protein [Megamonas]MBS7213117.1 hypothetical protein [Megamonas funiformis]MCB6828713.1 hypothetical protein [Megamonas funiformis]MDY3873949.1 hypothetical protein [Megamonas funiformis]